ncbi:uncharacterized protein CIMG_01905 [Coccidioides immitis RS]|uniref:Uncharacterized protein n=4 Tax=Coccidioides immitis TaxID=5501 RepID=J3KK74_COCIM|nr:uncharacterized protein CIMG_01905 [Coccidioides immitis RS]EAS36551.3 hypothetical protein CIMG_01905 [Coccidioides immitis RS]KMP01912.1 hypothetical protein CIRG_02051 [Coccidioides immitis RMSCC 2394]KMU73009.1 hypothetical protein CISG_09890 [Coccidioides immitis RMSCC 3703]KMU90323.1 hypothetical protein CIHG_08132 [Coccidioides immitis H538.4]
MKSIVGNIRVRKLWNYGLFDDPCCLLHGDGSFFRARSGPFPTASVDRRSAQPKNTTCCMRKRRTSEKDQDALSPVVTSFPRSGDDSCSTLNAFSSRTGFAREQEPSGTEI